MHPLAHLRQPAPLLMLILACLLSLSACRQPITPAPRPEGTLPALPPDPNGPTPLALVNGTLIDGSGGEPLSDAVVLLQGQYILAAGAQASVTIPTGAKIIDVQGGTILPGFINAHVHRGFSAKQLATWAQAGITTVRDEGYLARSLDEALKQREKEFNRPEYARLISAGQMITVPRGYGALFVASIEDARRAVERELNLGTDLIKISLEDGYAGTHGLPKLSKEQMEAIVQLAHQRGTRVSGHITQSKYLEQMVAVGVDDIAHTPYDHLSDEAITEMVQRKIALNTTFTVLRNYNGLGVSVDNLRRFAKAGGEVVLGNDFSGGPGEFETGMPMYEIKKMQEAEMTPMQIILAGTRNAARACNQAASLGTLEPGKTADVLVIRGDPLHDLNALTNVQMIIHLGVIIRSSEEQGAPSTGVILQMQHEVSRYR